MLIVEYPPEVAITVMEPLDVMQLLSVAVVLIYRKLNDFYYSSIFEVILISVVLLVVLRSPMTPAKTSAPLMVM